MTAMLGESGDVRKRRRIAGVDLVLGWAMRVRTAASVMLGLAAIAASMTPGCRPRETLPPVRILGISRQPDLQLPAAAVGRGEAVVPVVIRIPRPQLALLARRSDSLELHLFACDRPRRRHFGSDLYLEGMPIRRFVDGALIGNERALLEREAAASAKGPTAEIVALAPRAEIDERANVCAVFNLYDWADSSASVRIPPPDDADLVQLGIVVELVERPPDQDNDRFAVDLLRREARRLRLSDEIWDSSTPPLAVRETDPNFERGVTIYYDSRQPPERPGRFCLVRARLGGLRSAVRAHVYRRCAGRLGVRPAAEPPGSALIGPTRHYFREQSRWITCLPHRDCPELEAALRDRDDKAGNQAVD